MIETSVAVVKGEYTSKLLYRALDLIAAKKLVQPEDSVLIKPNCVVAKTPDTGLTTDSRIVEGTIEFVKNLGVEDVVIAEGGAGRSTEEAFEATGMKAVSKRQGVKLVDLNQDARVKVKIPHFLELRQMNIAESVIKSTCIINVPTLKVHHLALATLSMKNLMGAILPKSIMHGNIDEKIVDLCSVLKNKVKLNIVDGLVGAETDEINGSPVKMDLIIAGSDMVAVDTISTTIMGIDPTRVKYLQLAAEREIGLSNLDKMEVLGEKVEKVRRKFKLPPDFQE